MPLSPITARNQRRPFGTGLGLSGISLELTESSMYSSSSSVERSYSSDSLGQMQFDGGNMGSFWAPRRSQTRLQSRRSQSREELNSSFTEAHLLKL